MDDRLGRSFDEYRQRTIVRSLRYTESTIKPTLSDALANTAPKGKREENPVAPLPLDSAVLDHRLAYYVVADTSFLSFVNLR